MPSLHKPLQKRKAPVFRLTRPMVSQAKEARKIMNRLVARLMDANPRLSEREIRTEIIEWLKRKPGHA